MNDLLFTPGNDNLSGIVGEIAVLATADLLTPPTLAAATSLKTANASPPVFKPGKKCAKVYLTDETAKCETKSVGERDGKARETILSGRYPLSGTALEDFIRQAQNTPAIVFFRKKQNGKVFSIGLSQLDIGSTALSEGIPAYFEAADSTTGEKVADQNGTLMSWKFAAAHGPIEVDIAWANLFVAGSE
jgi:hypothetical protein